MNSHKHIKCIIFYCIYVTYCVTYCVYVTYCGENNSPQLQPVGCLYTLTLTFLSPRSEFATQATQNKDLSIKHDKYITHGTNM